MHRLRPRLPGLCNKLPHFLAGQNDHFGNDIPVLIQRSKGSHPFPVTLEPVQLASADFRQQHPKRIGTDSNGSCSQWKHLIRISKFQKRSFFFLVCIHGNGEKENPAWGRRGLFRFSAGRHTFFPIQGFRIGNDQTDLVGHHIAIDRARLAFDVSVAANAGQRIL